MTRVILTALLVLSGCVTVSTYDKETEDCIEMRRSIAHEWPIDDPMQLEEEIVQGCL